MSELRVKIARKQAEAQGICSFELVAADGRSLPKFTAGAHIDVVIKDGLVRQYSLCNAPSENGRYVIGVLKAGASRGGSLSMHNEIHEGDEISISPPKNHFSLEANAKSSLLLAGGIGITPIICMAEQLSAGNANFKLHYCSRSPERAAFIERILNSAFRNNTCFHFDDGEVDQQLNLVELLKGATSETHIYVCGPQGFIDAVLKTAREQGCPEARLHYEFFSAENDTGENDTEFEVALASSGKIVKVGREQTVVDALANIGVEIPTSCEQGVCGTCLTRILEGVPDHKDLFLTPDEHAANNQFLPCCSRAKSKRLVLDL